MTSFQTIDIQPTQSGISLNTRKPSASIYSVKSARHGANIRRGSGNRRAAGIASQRAKAGYRPDLRKVRCNSPTSFLQNIPFAHKWLDILMGSTAPHYCGRQLEIKRNLVRTHWIAERLLKVGRGHVCNSNPFRLESIKLLRRSRHVAIGSRSMHLASARHFGDNILHVFQSS